MPKRKINSDIENLILKSYLEDNLSIAKIAELCNISNTSVRNIINKYGYTIENKTKYKKIYPINETFFDIIDTEEKAYFLGFLYADGYNDEKNNIISLSLQEKDFKILEEFKILINSERPLQYINSSRYNEKSQNQKRLCICSKHMSKQLAKLGCFQAKSLTLKFPTEDQIPEHLLRHFIRGMWDGDGTIYYGFIKQSKHKRLVGRFNTKCSLTSTVMFCEKMKEIFKELLNINTNIYFDKNREKTTRSANIQGTQQVRLFLEWIYNDSKIYLERKFIKCEEILKIIKENGWNNGELGRKHY